MTTALLCFGACLADDYAWPLDAPPGLTSSFAEYRPGHFHAGIDLKTWGEIGLKVFAVKDGYVSRVRTSPWGYGLAAYVKLEDGYTAVYAHLSAFAPSIAEVVENRQQETGRYTVDVHLAKGRIPVRRGEVIALSGDTGIGAAHLHFELRDAQNQPVNPLSHGFAIPDDFAPTIEQIAVCPIGPKSTVNGQHRPAILKLRWDPAKQAYGTDRVPQVFGCIGLAARITDRANRPDHRFEPSQAALHVDGAQVFCVRLDCFSYDDTHQVELDRSFALKAQGHGAFQNLWVAPGNRLFLYDGHQEWDGTLHYLTGRETRGVQLSKGAHGVRVTASDPAGNEAVATFCLVADAPPELLDVKAAQSGVEKSARCMLRGTACDADDSTLTLTLRRSLDKGTTWEHLTAKSVGPGPFRYEIQGVQAPAALYSAVATDSLGAVSCTRTAIVAGPEQDHEAPELKISEVFDSRFLELRCETTELLAAPLTVSLRAQTGVSEAVTAQQLGLRTYSAIVGFAPEREGGVRATFSGVDGAGNVGQAQTSHTQKTISPGRAAQISSADGKAKAYFPVGAAYDTLWPAVRGFEARTSGGWITVGKGYEFLPATVPFDRPVTVSLSYPEDYPTPRQLRICRLLADGTWEFVESTVDSLSNLVSSDVRYFSKYAVLADEKPPIARILVPACSEEIATDQPALVASVRDFESGIRREEHVIMKLDENKVISVYDPEAHTVSYQAKRPLSKGRHVLQVVVRDACGNQVETSSIFSVN